MTTLHFIEIFLLFVLAVVLKTEPVKKSLIPLGYLLFSIATDFLIIEVDSRDSFRQLAILKHISNNIDIDAIKAGVYASVNFSVIIWILFILVWEVRIRMIISSQQKNSSNERSNNR